MVIGSEVRKRPEEKPAVVDRRWWPTLLASSGAQITPQTGVHAAGAAAPPVCGALCAVGEGGGRGQEVAVWQGVAMGWGAAGRRWPCGRGSCPSAATGSRAQAEG